MHVGKVTVEWLCRERGTWGKRGWLWREWRREWLRGRAGRCVRLTAEKARAIEEYISVSEFSLSE